MTRSKWNRIWALAAAVAIGGGGAGLKLAAQTPAPTAPDVNSAATPPKTAPTRERFVTVSVGDTKVRCKVLVTWNLPGGGFAYQVKAVENGDMLTVVRDGNSDGPAKDANVRVYRWRDPQTPHPNAPVLPIVLTRHHAALEAPIQSPVIVNMPAPHTPVIVESPMIPPTPLPTVNPTAPEQPRIAPEKTPTPTSAAPVPAGMPKVAIRNVPRLPVIVNGNDAESAAPAATKIASQTPASTPTPAIAPVVAAPALAPTPMVAGPSLEPVWPLPPLPTPIHAAPVAVAAPPLPVVTSALPTAVAAIPPALPILTPAVALSPALTQEPFVTPASASVVTEVVNNRLPGDSRINIVPAVATRSAPEASPSVQPVLTPAEPVVHAAATAPARSNETRLAPIPALDHGIDRSVDVLNQSPWAKGEAAPVQPGRMTLETWTAEPPRSQNANVVRQEPSMELPPAAVQVARSPEPLPVQALRPIELPAPRVVSQEPLAVAATTVAELPPPRKVIDVPVVAAAPTVTPVVVPPTVVTAPVTAPAPLPMVAQPLPPVSTSAVRPTALAVKSPSEVKMMPATTPSNPAPNPNLWQKKSLYEQIRSKFSFLPAVDETAQPLPYIARGQAPIDYGPPASAYGERVVEVRDPAAAPTAPQAPGVGQPTFNRTITSIPHVQPQYQQPQYQQMQYQQMPPQYSAQYQPQYQMQPAQYQQMQPAPQFQPTAPPVYRGPVMSMPQQNVGVAMSPNGMQRVVYQAPAPVYAATAVMPMPTSATPGFGPVYVPVNPTSAPTRPVVQRTYVPASVRTGLFAAPDWSSRHAIFETRGQAAGNAAYAPAAQSGGNWGASSVVMKKPAPGIDRTLTLVHSQSSFEQRQLTGQPVVQQMPPAMPMQSMQIPQRLPEGFDSSATNAAPAQLPMPNVLQQSPPQMQQQMQPQMRPQASPPAVPVQPTVVIAPRPQPTHSAPMTALPPGVANMPTPVGLPVYPVPQPNLVRAPMAEMRQLPTIIVEPSPVVRTRTLPAPTNLTDLLGFGKRDSAPAVDQVVIHENRQVPLVPSTTVAPASRQTLVGVMGIGKNTAAPASPVPPIERIIITETAAPQGPSQASPTVVAIPKPLPTDVAPNAPTPSVANQIINTASGPPAVPANVASAPKTPNLISSATLAPPPVVMTPSAGTDKHATPNLVVTTKTPAADSSAVATNPNWKTSPHAGNEAAKIAPPPALSSSPCTVCNVCDSIPVGSPKVVVDQRLTFQNRLHNLLPFASPAPTYVASSAPLPGRDKIVVLSETIDGQPVTAFPNAQKHHSMAEPVADKSMTVTVGDQRLKCKIVESWTLPTGGQAYHVKAAETGEMITVVRDSAPAAGGKQLPARVFRWYDSKTSPEGAPVPPPSSLVAVAKNAPKTPDIELVNNRPETKVASAQPLPKGPIERTNAVRTADAKSKAAPSAASYVAVTIPANPAMDRPKMTVTSLNVPNPALSQMMRMAKDAPSPSQRELAVLALEDHSIRTNPQLVAFLSELAIKDRAPAVRAAALNALVRMNAPREAIAQTSTALRGDADARVQQAVTEATTVERRN